MKIRFLLMLSILFLFSCGSNSKSDPVAPADSVNVDQANFSSFPGLGDALATETASLFSARNLRNNAPTLQDFLAEYTFAQAAKLFYNVETIAAAKALTVDEGNNGNFRCIAKVETTRLLDKFLGADTNSCIIKTIGKNIGVANSGVTLVTEGVTKEQIFSRAATTKVIRMNVQFPSEDFSKRNNASFNVEIEGSGTSGSSYRVLTYGCGLGSDGITLTELNGTNREFTISEYQEEPACDNEDDFCKYGDFFSMANFSGKLNASMTGFDLTAARTYERFEKYANTPMVNSGRNLVSMDANGNLSIASFLLNGSGADAEDPGYIPQELKSVYASAVTGTGLFSLRIPQMSYKFTVPSDPENPPSATVKYEDGYLANTTNETLLALANSLFDNSTFFNKESISSLNVTEQAELLAEKCGDLVTPDIEVNVEIQQFQTIMDEACPSLYSVIRPEPAFRSSTAVNADYFGGFLKNGPACMQFQNPSIIPLN